MFHSIILIGNGCESMNLMNYSDALRLLDYCPHDDFYITPTPIILDGLFIQVNRAGIVTATPSDFHIVRDESYNFNVIHCVFRGRGYVRARDQAYALGRGQAFLLAAHEPHEYGSDPEDPMGLVWVEFAGGNSAQIVQYILDSGGAVYGGELFEALTNLCTSILYQTNQRNPRISQIIYEMLMRMCTSIESDLEISTMDQKILRYINRNISAQLTLADVAREFGYNPSYFSARFSRTFGMTFSKYLLRQRMSNARYLLVTTKWPVERIAQELGFYDMSHFIQRFKAFEGVTPARYRRQSRGFFDQIEGAP